MTRIRLHYKRQTRTFVNDKTILNTGTSLTIASFTQSDYIVGTSPTSSPPIPFTYGSKTYTVSSDSMPAGSAVSSSS